ncbi:unnamed protein product [Closterium sp. NIES-64]|nr:unnamed protein product [Closterium sp. NIES-64]
MSSPPAIRFAARRFQIAFLLPLLLTVATAASHVSQRLVDSYNGGWEGELGLPDAGGVLADDSAFQVSSNGVTRAVFHGRRALLQAPAPASEPPLSDTADPSASAPASSAPLTPASAPASASPSAPPSASPAAPPSASPSAPSAQPSSPSPGGASSGTPLTTPAAPTPPSGAGGGNGGNVGDGGATFDMPGPVCEGQCCSNAAPIIPDGMPKMTSSWLSSQLAHGAKIHVRHQSSGFWWRAAVESSRPNATLFQVSLPHSSVLPPQIHVRHQNSGFWWRAADGKTWSGSVATSSDFDQPDVSQALTVIRVSATTVSLGMCMCMFLPVGEGVMEGDEGEIIVERPVQQRVPCSSPLQYLKKCFETSQNTSADAQCSSVVLFKSPPVSNSPLSYPFPLLSSSAAPPSNQPPSPDPAPNSQQHVPHQAADPLQHVPVQGASLPAN